MTFSTIPDTSFVNNVDLHQDTSRAGDTPPQGTHAPRATSGEKAKARAILAAIRTLQAIEQAQRPATSEERAVLARFPSFGPMALGIFPDPVTGQYKDAGWQQLGDQLQALLTPEDYASARRTTFTAFYTAPVVMQAMYEALARLGVPADATVLEPGCGIGNFLAYAPAGMRFIGIELDRLSGRIARALHPGHDIRIEHFRDTRLPEGAIDAVIGNVPFADLRLDYHGMRLALHDFFLAKSLDALKPGDVLALVTSHYTLDKQHPGVRQSLAQQADFLGAICLSAEAFAQEGTRVVTDILCLRKRAAGEAPTHVDPTWLETAPLAIEGHHPKKCKRPSGAANNHTPQVDSRRPSPEGLGCGRRACRVEGTPAQARPAGVVRSRASASERYVVRACSAVSKSTRERPQRSSFHPSITSN